MNKLQRIFFASMAFVVISGCSSLASIALSIPTASAEIADPLTTVTIVQPANDGYTHMASPLIVTTNVWATCYYRVDADFVLTTSELPDPQRTIDNAAGTIHTANLRGLTAGSHKVYVHCYSDGGEITASSTWTKLSPGNTKLLGVYGDDEEPGTLWEINSETGEPTRNIGPVRIESDVEAAGLLPEMIGIPLYITALAQEPTSGKLYATTGTWPNPYNRNLVTIDPATAKATLVGPLCQEGAFIPVGIDLDGCEGFLHEMTDISFNGSGQLYGWSEELGGNLYTIDKNNGLVTLVRSDEGSYETYGAANGISSQNAFNLLPDISTLVEVNTTSGIMEDSSWELDMYPFESGAYGAADYDAANMFFGQAFEDVDGEKINGALVVIQKINATTGVVVNLNAGDFRATFVDDINADMTLMTAISFYTPKVSTGGFSVPKSNPSPIEENPQDTTGNNQGSESGLPGSVTVSSLVKAIDSTAVYFIGADKKRHPFPNLDIYYSWFSDFSLVKTISAEDLALIPLGTNVTIRPGTWLIKIQSEPTVYAIQPDRLLTKISSETLATALYGSSWYTKVKDVDPTLFTDYTIGTETQELVNPYLYYPSGSVLQYADDSALYFIDGGVRRLITSETFIYNLLQEEFVIKNVPALPALTSGENWPSQALEKLIGL